MFVVRSKVEQAEAGSTLRIRLVGMHDPRMHGFLARTIAMLILDLMTFEVSE